MQVFALGVKASDGEAGIDEMFEHTGLGDGTTDDKKHARAGIGFEQTHTRAFASALVPARHRRRQLQAHAGARQRRVTERSVLDHFARAQYQHMRGVLVELGEDVRGDDQRHALALQAREQACKHMTRLGIEAGGRLIEDQYLGRMNQRLPDSDALALAA